MKPTRCPKCGGQLTSLEELNALDKRWGTLLSATVRCASCNCSVGLAVGRPPQIVYDPTRDEDIS